MLSSNMISNIKVIILVGGKGTRIQEITQGKIPKGLITIDAYGRTTGIEYITSVLRKVGFEEKDIVLSVGYLSESYYQFAQGRDFVFFHQRPLSTSGAVEDVMHHYGNSYQYLVLSGDIYFDYRDLVKLIQSHQLGNITWGVTPLEHSEMEPYYGLVVDQASQSILGDIKLPWWRGHDLSGKNLYVKGAMNILDPQVYLASVKMFRRLSPKKDVLDLYWDILPMIEEQNRRRVIRGKQSLLQAVILDHSFIDYGTAERLELTRTIFNREQQVFPVFDPVTEDFLYYKDRGTVHLQGDWHRGIQANIVRPNKQRSFDILIQVRSRAVDIGKGKYDQSLATQMLRQDGLSELAALYRGLASELGIRYFSYEKIDAHMRIIKTYQEEQEAFNRELISLYLVHTENVEAIRASSPKVEQLLWMDWQAFLTFFRSHPSQFTKTAQFYFGCDILCEAIEQTTYDFLGLPCQQESRHHLEDKVLFHSNLVDTSVGTLVYTKTDFARKSHLFI